MLLRRLLALVAVLAAFAPSPGAAQGRPNAEALTGAQREAMKALAAMDGVWRGPGWTLSPSGQRQEFTQTERVGSFLDGTIKVIEGRGYEPDGRVGFNAFAIISFSPDRRTYGIRSYSQGNIGDFTFTPTPDGFVWEIPAGPSTIRYTATIKDGTWREVGDRIVPGGQTVRFIELNLTRAGDTTWPAAGAVPPR